MATSTEPPPSAGTRLAAAFIGSAGSSRGYPECERARPRPAARFCRFSTAWESKCDWSPAQCARFLRSGTRSAACTWWSRIDGLRFRFRQPWYRVIWPEGAGWRPVGNCSSGNCKPNCTQSLGSLHYDGAVFRFLHSERVKSREDQQERKWGSLHTKLRGEDAAASPYESQAKVVRGKIAGFSLFLIAVGISPGLRALGN